VYNAWVSMWETSMIIGRYMWSILKIKRRLTWWYWKRYVVLFQMVRHVSTEEEQLGSNELFFFVFIPLFSFLVSDFTSTFSKIKYVMSIYICINFYPYSFDYYLFCFQYLLKLIFFLISFLSILFHLIFLSHLVPIILIVILIFILFSI